MSVVDEKFDPAPVEAWETEPTPKPAPSRPTDNTRIMGMAPDTWALMLERKIDAFDNSQRERADQHVANFNAFKSEVLDVLKKVVEVLQRQEQHEKQLGEQRVDINVNTRAIGAHDDQIAQLKRDVAVNDARIAKLETAAKKRLRR